mgnify:CR=1 FL=1
MEVTSVRLTKKELQFLEQLIAKGKYASISEALKAGLYELMREEQLKEVLWQTRAEVRAHFAKKERKLKGFEASHDEED